MTIEPFCTAEERPFVKELLAIFALVDARAPHKGIQPLLIRARYMTHQQNISYPEALRQTVDDARKRTQARLALMGNCPVKPKPS